MYKSRRPVAITGSGLVTMLNEVVNQRDEVVVSYTAKVLLKRRS